MPQTSFGNTPRILDLQERAACSLENPRDFHDSKLSNRGQHPFSWITHISLCLPPEADTTDTLWRYNWNNEFHEFSSERTLRLAAVNCQMTMDRITCIVTTTALNVPDNQMVNMKQEPTKARDQIYLFYLLVIRVSCLLCQL